jgi:LacI family transcriptional regulator/LacI family purine nucleotide synthesis repressor
MSATIHTIAKEAGVSVSTVSKVINGTGKISQETVTRILKIIREHNYVPQQRRQAGNSIAVITFLYENVSFSRSYDSNVLRGICKSAFELGLDVTLVNGEKIMQMTVPELHRYFLTSSLSGAILLGETSNKLFETCFREANLPFVCIGSCLGSASVTTDSENAVRSMLDYMICLGHRKIAYLGLITDRVETHEKRFRAFFSLLEENNIPLPEEYVINLPDAQNDTIRNALTRLMARRVPPDAIFFESEAQIETINILRSLDFLVPEDISVSGFYCTESDGGIGCSAIIQPTDLLGDSAVKNLYALINGQSASPVALPCKVIYGNTIRKLDSAK